MTFKSRTGKDLVSGNCCRRPGDTAGWPPCPAGWAGKHSNGTGKLGRPAAGAHPRWSLQVVNLTRHSQGFPPVYLMPPTSLPLLSFRSLLLAGSKLRWRLRRQ